MAIIYSYPKVQQPALSDLLIGTDVSTKNKVTKSFSIQSIVDLVETAVPGGGTVTNIATANSTFVTLTGGPISTTGTLTAALSATGAASATTFLRGDNTWATIPSSSNTTYTLSSAQNGSAANIRLTGSTGSQNIVTLLAGANITLTDNGLNGIVISSSASGGGSCCSVNAGTGLKIESGSVGSNPFIGVDYLGSNNYILKGESQTTITEQDYIPFNDISTGNVKTTTMGVIPPSALSLVKDYIDAGDANDITNDTDAYTTTAKVEKVVSLTSAEYASITPNANTLYLIVGALPTYTVTLAFTNTISGTEYTIGGSQAGATQTGISGSSYAFNTTITPNAGFYFSSGPVITNATGTITTNETVYTLLSGTVEAIPTPQCTATLDVNTTGIQGTQFTLGGSLTGATATGDCPLDITGVFNTTITANPGYEFTTGPVIENATGVISGNQTVETCITGIIEAIAAPVTVTPNAVNNFTANGFENQVTLSVSPGSISGDSPLDYSFTGSATPNSGYEISNLSISGLNGQATVSGTVDIIFTGTITELENEIIVNDTPVNNIQGPSAGYTITYSPSSLQITGTTPSLTYEFAHSVALNSGYKWVNDVVPTVTNAQGTLTVAGTYAVQSTIGNPGQSTVELIPDIVAELDVTYSITGDNVWSPAGNLDGTQQSGPAPLTYNFDTYANGTPTITIPANYQFVSGPTTLPVSISGTINSSTVVAATVTAEIAEIVEPGEVILTFSNNVNGSQNTTTALGTTTTISGNAGDPYTFTNSITADPGYEFTSPAVWTPSSIITGTIAAGTTNITQSVTGTVTAIPVQLTSFTTNASPEVSGESACAAGLGTTRYHDGTSTYPEIGDIVYLTNSTGGGNLGAGYWGLANSTYFQTNSSGVVIDVQLCAAPPQDGTVNVNFTNNVVGKANTTTTIADGGTASATGPVGTSYSITNSISANGGYEFTSGPTWSTGGTGTVTGTFVSGTTNINQNVTGTVEAVAPSYTALSLRMNLNNAPYGWTSSTLACNGTGTPLTVYVQPIYSNWNDVVGSNAKVYTDQNLTNILAATGGNQYYQEGSDNYLRIDNFGDALTYASCPVEPTYNYYFAQPCGGGTTIYMRSVTTFSPGEVFKLSGDSTCYEVGASGAPINSNDPVESFPDCSACLPAQGTVNLTFSNNTSDPANTTTTLGAFTSVTQDVGTTYTFANSITANSGYEFTSGPTWNPSSTITGTVTSGTTNITQEVTGIVEEIPPVLYYRQYRNLTACPDTVDGAGIVRNISSTTNVFPTYIQTTQDGAECLYSFAVGSAAGAVPLDGGDVTQFVNCVDCFTPPTYYKLRLCTDGVPGADNLYYTSTTVGNPTYQGGDRVFNTGGTSTYIIAGETTETAGKAQITLDGATPTDSNCPPVCNSTQIYVSTVSAEDAYCTQTVLRTVYHNGSTWADATVIYGTSSDCSTPQAGNRWYSDGIQTWFWNGITRTSIANPSCP